MDFILTFVTRTWNYCSVRTNLLIPLLNVSIIKRVSGLPVSTQHRGKRERGFRHSSVSYDATIFHAVNCYYTLAVEVVSVRETSIDIFVSLCFVDIVQRAFRSTEFYNTVINIYM